MPLMNLGGVRNMPSNYSMWFELGGHGVDTALIYGDDVQAEVGRAVIESSLARSDIFVTTKITCGKYAWDGVATGIPDVDIKHAFNAIGLSYVDLFLLHSPCRKSGSREIDVEATMKTYRFLEALIEQGKARAIGISNFKAADLDAFMPEVTVRPSVNQCEFSIGNHDDATLKRCQELGITYSAYSPLGGLNDLDVLHHPDVTAVAAAHGRSTAEVALRWVTQQGVVAVTASDKESHQKSDLSIFDFDLTEDEMKRLAAIQPNVRAGSSFGLLPMLCLVGGAAVTSLLCFLSLKRGKAEARENDLSRSLQTISGA